MTDFLGKVEFIEDVMRLHPKVAVFDCDGTLWSKDAGTLFMEWSLEERLVDAHRAAWIAERHRQYRAGQVGEAQMCGEMTTVYAGLREEELRAHARRFFRRHIAPHIFADMLELARRLSAAGTALWAVSSSNAQMIQAALEDFGIAPERILATQTRVHQGTLTEDLLGVPTGAAKRHALAQAGVADGYAGFGNSVHDTAMLEAARWPFAVNPNPDLAAVAQQRGWPVYWPSNKGVATRN